MSLSSLLFIFCTLITASASAYGGAYNTKILVQYDQQAFPKNAKNQINITSTIQLLRDTHANSFSFLLWSTTGEEYLDFVRMLSLTSNLTIDGVQFTMWLTLIPPTEVQNNTKCSVPADSSLTSFNETSLFNMSLGYRGCQDYVGWADVIGRLGLLYPHLYAVNIDDFSSNTRTFTEKYLTSIRSKLEGRVRLIPTFYYGPLETQHYLGRLTDGVLFYFRNDREGQQQCRSTNSSLNAVAVASSNSTCNAPVACTKPCLCGTCADYSLRNIPTEVNDFATALPDGHLIFVGIYFTGYSSCPPSPSSTYNRQVLEAALALPSVHGATIYTTKQPIGLASDCEMGSKDKGCIVREVFGHWNRTDAALAVDLTCPASKPFIVSPGKQICCDQTSSLASGCLDDTHGCCLFPGAFGCPIDMPVCFCPSNKPFKYGNAKGGLYCCANNQGFPSKCVGGNECCLVPGIDPMLGCQNRSYCTETNF